MPSKLKRRRWRRMWDDLAWYKDKAKDLHYYLMELADGVVNLRKQILPVFKTVTAKLKIYETDKDDRDHQLCRRCSDGVRGGRSPCAYNVRRPGVVSIRRGNVTYGLFARMGERWIRQ